MIFFGEIMQSSPIDVSIFTMSKRFTLVMTLSTLRVPANIEIMIFSSSIPVSVTVASTRSMPSSIKRSLSVPSPFITMTCSSCSDKVSARSRSDSMSFTSMPIDASIRARKNAILPPPMIMTVRIRFSAIPSFLKKAASSEWGAVMCMMSFSSGMKSPDGIMTSSPRRTAQTSIFTLYTLESSLSLRPQSGCPSSILTSTRSIRPFANVSTLIAAGNWIIRSISCAASYSGLTAIESPNSRRMNEICSAYSGLRTRAIVCFVPSLRATRQHMMLSSSCAVTAISRSALAAPASS